MRLHFKRLSLAVFLAFAVVSGNVALSDPPDHAKAHGWRKKNDPRYVGYTGRNWERDYGIIEGHCNRKEIGTVVGAVVGGVIGSQVTQGENRPVAIVVGSILGAVIGREIGKDLDEGDRACVGHALELAKVGQPVRWVNDVTRVSYLLTPLAVNSRDPEHCRRFKIDATHDGKSRSSNQLACRDSTGAWKISG